MIITENSTQNELQSLQMKISTSGSIEIEFPCLTSKAYAFFLKIKVKYFRSYVFSIH